MQYIRRVRIRTGMRNMAKMRNRVRMGWGLQQLSEKRIGEDCDQVFVTTVRDGIEESNGLAGSLAAEQ
jgi:hypothetical protein